MTLKKYPIYILVVVLVILGIWGVRALFYEGFIRLNYPSLSEFPIQGIDISHHQKSIEWDKLPRDRVQFVFIKATEGTDHLDSMFYDNVRQANARGIPAGAYHFFTFCSSGKKQAEHFINTTSRVSLQLAPVVDLEFGGNCGLSLTDDQLLHEVSDFLTRAELHFNRPVVLYATAEFYERFLTTHLLKNPLWIRDIYQRPQLNNRQWLFWQYANRGRIDGIDGPVDLNVFRYNPSVFKQFID